MIGYLGEIRPEIMAVVVGVKGAGRKTFASLYFPGLKFEEKKIRLSAKVTEAVVVIVLDCCHLQNQAEADLLNDVAKTVKRWKSKTVSVLLVFGRADLVCSRHQNRAWMELVMREYEPFVKTLKVTKSAMVAHSNLAVKHLRQMMDGEVDADDKDDLEYLLSRAGRRLPKFVSVATAKKYVCSHLKSLQMLSGEYFAKEFLTARKDNSNGSVSES